MSKTGRNDPCPCGSEKKYKKCCLGKALEPQSKVHYLSRRYTQKDRASAIDKLLSFSSRPEFEKDCEIGVTIFFGSQRTEEEMETLQDLGQTAINFHTWLLYDMNVEDGRTITDFFLERQGKRLNTGESTYLKAARQTSLRLYEVHRVEKNKGFLLEDLWDGKQYEVSERTATHSVVQWDLVVTRLIDTGNYNFEIEGGLYNYPARTKPFLLEGLKKTYEEYYKSPAENRDDTEFFKRVAVFFNRWWIDLVAFPERPEVLTSEGDEFVFTRVIFDQKGKGQITVALDASSEFELDENDQYIWGEDASESRRIMGNLLFSKNRIILETNSKERGEQGRELLERILGDAIRYRITEYQDIKQALKSEPKKGKPAPSSLPPEVEAQLVKDFLDKHYEKWLDEKIPALSNRTPRHAVTLKTYRPKVIDLLKEMENMEAHAATPEKEPYDFGWIWKALGLEDEREQDL